MLIRAYYIASCIAALNADQVSLSRHYFDFDKLRKQHRLHPRLIALGARISLLENDSRAAESQFRAALKLSEGRESDRFKYVEHYCRYFLNFIEGTGRHEDHRFEASRLHPGHRLKAALPLPRGEISLDEVDRLNSQLTKTLH